MGLDEASLPPASLRRLLGFRIKAADWRVRDMLSSVSCCSESRTTGWGTTTNGRSYSDLKDPLGRDDAAFISAVLGRMDGERLFAWSIWRLPRGRTVEGLDVRQWPQEYLQAAGNAEGMVVEIRHQLDPGVYAHDAVGKDVPGAQTLPRLEEVAWDQYVVPAASNEVLDSKEASEIFMSYYRGEGIPAGYRLRPAATRAANHG